jgi:hypothetical protein
VTHMPAYGFYSTLGTPDTTRTGFVRERGAQPRQCPSQYHERAQNRRAEVVRLTALGFSAAQIAVWLGISARHVQRCRAAAGITQPCATPLTADEIARAEQMLDDGASLKEVARTLGRCREAIERRFPGRAWTPTQVAEWRHMKRALEAL